MNTVIQSFTLGTSIFLFSCAGLAIAGNQCYKIKPPLGCSGCGTSAMAYCEEGCQVGTPGKTGPGSLTTFYCYSLGEGESASWPCDDPNNPVPSGWTMTQCAPDGSGMCCITDDSARASSATYNKTGNDSCLHGNDCGEDPE